MSAEPVAYRFTVDDFFQMAETGVLDPDKRLELIQGEIVEMSPTGRRHAGTVAWLTHFFTTAPGPTVVWSQSTLRLGTASAPEPDVLVLSWQENFYRDVDPTPADVLLAVEVSETSAGWDRRVKRPLYARAGIGELWIVDLAGRRVEVARQPGADDYETLQTFRAGAHIAATAFPNLELSVSDLLG
jgi:Uma2 family endonuclease